jgi:hypothetical protein
MEIIMLYHVYIDEGGMFGSPRIYITKSKVFTKRINDNNHIGNYYQGKMTELILKRYVDGLSAIYKGTSKIVCPDEISYLFKCLNVVE